MTKTVNGKTYDEYMAAVDYYLCAALGVGHGDLCDFMTYDAFEGEVDPRETAYNIAENDGMVPQDLLDRIWEV